MTIVLLLSLIESGMRYRVYDEAAALPTSGARAAGIEHRRTRVGWSRSHFDALVVGPAELDEHPPRIRGLALAGGDWLAIGHFARD
jgi:hypothetical protein